MIIISVSYAILLCSVEFSFFSVTFIVVLGCSSAFSYVQGSVPLGCSSSFILGAIINDRLPFPVRENVLFPSFSLQLVLQLTGLVDNIYIRLLH